MLGPHKENRSIYGYSMILVIMKFLLALLPSKNQNGCTFIIPPRVSPPNYLRYSCLIIHTFSAKFKSLVTLARARYIYVPQRML